jgi:methanogenic corrinoid protein MtbC1
MSENDLQYNHKNFLDLLLSGSHLKCSELVQRYLDDKITTNELYENIMKKALYDVGELWEFNKISVASEHLASAIVEAILNEQELKTGTKNKVNKTVIVTCVENEFHQIGLKMVGNVFEMSGWNVNFLGANTPTQDLISFTKKTNPDLIAISLCLYFNLPVLENLLQLLNKELPDLKILIGGQAFRHGGQEILSKYQNTTYLPDLYSTELFIKNLN